MVALGATQQWSSWRRLRALASGTGVLSLGFAGTAFLNAGRLRYERVTIPVEDLPSELDGFRIVQFSDLHLGRPFTRRHVRDACRWALARNPDLLVITGDMVSFSRDIPLLRSMLAGLRARHGLFAVFGNHDYWTDIDALSRALAELGVELLRNESRTIQVGDASLRLVGLDCVWEGRHDLAQAFAQHADAAVTVVLAHEPDIADEVAPYGAALQLSGHTHAGHFALPGLGPAFLPRHGFRYFRGLQQIGQLWLYVSRGMGGLPLRVGAPPEVTELTLRPSDR